MSPFSGKPNNPTLSGMTFAGGRPTNVGMLILLMLLTLAAGLTIQSIVNDAMKDVIGNQLVTIRDSSVAAIRRLLSDEIANCRRLVRAIQTDAIAIESDADSQPISAERLRNEPAYRTLLHVLETNFEADRYQGWILMTPSGVILAAWDSALVGTVGLGIPADAMNRVVSGRATVSMPFFTKLHDQPVMAVMAPVIDDDVRTRAVFALLLSPLDDLTSILRVAWNGETGNTYAFDRRGVMISQCRFEKELRGYGLLPRDETVSSVLAVHLRDPAVDLEAGERLQEPVDQLPMTRMAIDATRGGSSLDTRGYRDYRGANVIGAWAFLSDYEMGIATEISVNEAYRPMRVLRWSNIALFGLLMLAGSIIAFTTARITRAERKASKEHRIAKKLGQYRLEEQLGVGGMGTVYKAQHALLMRPVAIKVLSTKGSDVQSLHRFQREVELTSQLNNPHTITIYDYGRTQAGDFYYVMEYLDGMDLGLMIRQYGDMSVARTIHVLRQICGSLIEAHSKGLIHRDIKPGNIMLTELGGVYDFAKLLDFGLVKESTPESANMTHEGSLTGTPMYMSPEAIRNARNVDCRSDIYSIGAVGYYLVTGKPIFDVAGTIDALLNQINEVPERPSERAGKPIHDDFEQLLLACLSKEPEHRPQTVEELVAMLDGCKDANAWTQACARRWWTSTYSGWQRHSTILSGNETIAPVVNSDEGTPLL